MVFRHTTSRTWPNWENMEYTHFFSSASIGG
jgi:hypothetical protein